jgi:DNA-3-methyladenine glycosylase II
VSEHRALSVLTGRDRGLARIVERHGPPPLWARRPGFATLARIILEQQVSLASAATLYRRVARELGGVWTTGAVLAEGEAGLRRRGLTRQKARYVVALASSVESGALSLRAVSRMGDAEARAALERVPGIGAWTSSIYLLMALRRPDVWPAGDLALHIAVRDFLKPRRTVTTAVATQMAERWRPWRSVAAKILWWGYLAVRR